MAYCRLCGNDRKLVNSHIIPKSFWNIENKSSQSPAVLSSKRNWRPIKSPIGEYDGNILCESCDNRLGVFDQHAFEKLVVKSGNLIQQDNSQARAYEYDDADPITILKFMISVAWRASVSTRNYFTRIQLGPYEDQFKSAFEDGQETLGEIDCLISEFDQRDVAFLNPQYSRMEGVRFVVIFANRFTFYVKVDRQKMPNIFKSFAIRAGKPVVSIVRQWEGSKQQDAMRQLVNSNPRPKFWT